MIALIRLLTRPDFRAHPLRGVWRRVWWRVRWWLTSRPLLTTVGNGLRIAVPRSSSAAPLFYGGWSEPEEAALLERLVHPSDVVFDVGAHVGEYTLLAAARSATVHSFEPNPANAALLRANVASNALANVTVHECAVSDRECQVRFLAHRDPSLSALWTERQTHAGYSEITVRAIPLDSVTVPRIDVIKIDVEGAELAVLRGARAILARPPETAPVVVFEFAPGNYARFGCAPRDVLNLLTGHGYRIARIDGTPFDGWPAELSMVNLIASKRPIWPLVPRGTSGQRGQA